MSTDREKVEQLVQRAISAQDSGDAMRYSQAAVNAANALRVIFDIETDAKKVIGD